jgi:hypothetical protein
MLRQARQGLTVTLRCNLRAWQAERFDVLYVSLDRFGWAEKPFEVMSSGWTPDGAIELVLRETSPIIWDIDAGFPDYDFAPNTNMPTPWSIPEITGLVATSSGATAQILPDGTVVPRMQVNWNAVTDSRVLQGGYIEIRYWLLGDVTDNYATWRVSSPGDTVAFVTGIRAGAQYLATARACSVIAQSPWCAATLTNSGGRSTSPANVSGMAYTLGSGRVHFTWNADTTDPDYKLTEVRIGSTWASGTKVIGVAGIAGDWIPSSLGSYTAWFAHQSFSGIYSGTPQSLAVTVDSSINGSGAGGTKGGNYTGRASVTPQSLTAVVAYRFDSTGVVERKAGNNATAPFVPYGTWKSSAAGSEQIEFDLVVQNNAYGTPSLSGLGTWALSSSPTISLSATNQIGTATVLYTITDGSGNQLSTGFLLFDVDSSP